jgi:two-component system, LytTR family, sensor kinase
MVKKLNLQTGIPFSLLISVIAGLLRLIQSADFGMYLVSTFAYFSFSLLCWIGNSLLIETKWVRKTGYNKPEFYLLSVLGGVAFSALFAWFNTLVKLKAPAVIEIVVMDSRRSLLLFYFLRGALLNLLNAFIVSHLKQIRDHQQNQLALEHLKQSHLQASLNSLKQQLSPHFLFNTLNTLSSLTQEQPVKDYVDQLANVYRYLLDYQKKDAVDLATELAFTKSYLYILGTRLDTALEIRTQIDIDTAQYKIPPLTLQLLVENAIKHNIASTVKPLRISISVDEGYVVVTNNLQPRTSVATSSGTGLTNINQRYQFLFNREIKIEMDDRFFTVKLPLLS